MVADPNGLTAYGLQRGLKSHHIQLLAISGVIGTGLFVGTSGTLASAGPGGLLIGYSIWYVFGRTQSVWNDNSCFFLGVAFCYALLTLWARCPPYCLYLGPSLLVSHSTIPLRKGKSAK